MLALSLSFCLAVVFVGDEVESVSTLSLVSGGGSSSMTWEDDGGN